MSLYVFVYSHIDENIGTYVIKHKMSATCIYFHYDYTHNYIKIGMIFILAHPLCFNYIISLQVILYISVYDRDLV